MTQETKKVDSGAWIEEMARYAITCVPVDNFYYREFHYTNLDDAIAQATRDAAQPRLSSDTFSPADAFLPAAPTER